MCIAVGSLVWLDGNKLLRHHRSRVCSFSGIPLKWWFSFWFRFKHNYNKIPTPSACQQLVAWMGGLLVLPLGIDLYTNKGLHSPDHQSKPPITLPTKYSVVQSRPFDLLVFPFWSIFSHGPKRLTFQLQVLWATESNLEPAQEPFFAGTWSSRSFAGSTVDGRNPFRTTYCKHPLNDSCPFADTN